MKIALLLPDHVFASDQYQLNCPNWNPVIVEHFTHCPRNWANSRVSCRKDHDPQSGQLKASLRRRNAEGP